MSTATVCRRRVSFEQDTRVVCVVRHPRPNGRTGQSQVCLRNTGHGIQCYSNENLRVNYGKWTGNTRNSSPWNRVNRGENVEAPTTPSTTGRPTPGTRSKPSLPKDVSRHPPTSTRGKVSWGRRLRPVLRGLVTRPKNFIFYVLR